MDPIPSSISLYWTRLFGAMIILRWYRVAGLYDGSPPTARALNWPHCRGNEMRTISCTRWAGDGQRASGNPQGAQSDPARPRNAKTQMAASGCETDGKCDDQRLDGLEKNLILLLLRS